MKLKNLAVLSLAVAAVGCSSKKETSTADATAPAAEVVAAPALQEKPLASTPVNVIPKAVVYKIEGNATAANVPVVVAPSGNGQIVSYPAPSDVVGQEPLPMADGYLLDRRGISANSVFTKWTYAEYAALTHVPSGEEIKAAIIPGARPTQIHVLPMTLSEALADTAAVNRIINNF